MTQPNSITTVKRQVRDTMLKKRAALTDRERALLSRDIVSRCFAEIPFQRHDIVAVYSPTRGEVDITLLIELLTEEGISCALPVIQQTDGPLLFRSHITGAPLTRHSRFGVMEPDPRQPIVSPSIIIVPLIAFDATGARLGFGGGFYDRTLALLSKKELLTVGIAYDFQQVEKLPTEAHDQRLDCVVTEKRTIICTDHPLNKQGSEG